MASLSFWQNLIFIRYLVVNFTRYLLERFQRVNVHNNFSAWFKILSGLRLTLILRSIILSLMLFSILQNMVRFITLEVILSRYSMDFLWISKFIQRRWISGVNVVSPRGNKFGIQRKSMQYLLYYIILLFKKNEQNKIHKCIYLTT